MRTALGRTLIFVVLLAGCGCSGEGPSEAPPASLDPGPESPYPATVPIDAARRTTSGETALRNLNAQIEGARQRSERLPTDQSGLARLVGLLQHRVGYAGTFDDFSEIDRLTARLLELAPESASAHSARAAYLGAVHRFEEAGLALDRAEELGGSARSIELSRITTSLALGEDPEALNARAEAVHAAMPDFRSGSTLAATLAAAGRFEDADAQYRSTLDAYVDVSPFPVAWIAFRRGVMWSESADAPHLAVPLYQEAVRRLPGYVVANVHLSELEEPDAAIRRLEGLTTVGDPEPRGKLASALAERDPARSRQLVAEARARYDELLTNWPAAFADHGSEFFSGPGGDPQRGLALALSNLELRQDPRAYKVAIEAAVAAGDEPLACALAADAAPLRSRHPVLDATVGGLACSSDP